MSGTSVQPAEHDHRSPVLAIARRLADAGDTYAFPPGITDDELWAYWSPSDGNGFVALRDGQVVGMFVIRPNHPGPASHVANASYATRADARGSGVGRAMGEASLGEARRLGYRAMQFNIVVSTNEPALRLWRSLGFEIVGTVPEGFRTPAGGYVDHHIMYRKL